MTRNELVNKVNRLLKEKNVTGDPYETPDEVKIEILKEILPDVNLKIGQYVNRRNSAGESFNKIIGFKLSWNDHFDEPYFSHNLIGIHIVCDRVKRYNPEYSAFYNEPEFAHGEIWCLCELLDWRDRGQIEEDSEKAQKDYEEALSTATKSRDCRYAYEMLSW